MMKNIHSIFLYLAIIFVFSAHAQIKNQSTIIPAHAHNDYHHKQPLFDALKYNFKSIEVDVFSIGDSLFVAHDFDKMKPGFTLRNLYLDPLAELIDKNKGSVYGEGTEIILLVDIKDDGLKTYQILHQILEDYKSILSTYSSGNKKPGAIGVIVSGNRPIEYIQNQKIRYAGFDGRIANLDAKYSSSLMPLVSDNWNQHFKWKGHGEMPSVEREKLIEIARKTHEKGSKLRFWATPDKNEIERNAVWNELINAKVDLIGTDHLESLYAYFLEHKK